VLVTGSSGGIGAACARAFAAEGARVVVHYNRGEERARAVAAELGGVPPSSRRAPSWPRSSAAATAGWTVSPMTREALTEEKLEQGTRTMPLRKVATPEDVARQVVVLASDELSGHVTGQIVTVAGGMEGRVLR
jgi:NAD(P)-dependent dehydrogenase (short-subunit alcohol dehydrogenase family)